ncbi:LytTR family DNA-binding domain-containing protein [Leuconostocaceae bacterium ESL0723]|nr:LytTR family DNA-binding domain-containing protein [Leuconostocaceae bacterium ESL0723]
MEVSFNVNPDLPENNLSLNVRQENRGMLDLFDDLRDLVDRQQLQVSDEDGYRYIPVYQIERVYTEKKAVYCQTQSGVYRVAARIYQLRDELSRHRFIQISSGEIVNRAMIERFALTQSGLYQVILTNGQVCFASRRYMQQIRKEYLS